MVTNENGWLEITEIKSDVADIKKKLAEMYTALMGSSLTKDGGLVNRVIESENQIELLTLRITEIEKNGHKHKLYLSIIWAIGGAIGTSIILAIISHFIK
jgi:hypothetical protein